MAFSLVVLSFHLLKSMQICQHCSFQDRLTACCLLLDPKPPGRRQRTRSAAPGQILYIQMEFCPRTLAQVLEAGGLDEADAWMVLRGILAGLAHIHAQVWTRSVVIVLYQPG